MKKYLLEPELAFLKKILLDEFIVTENSTTYKKFKLTEKKEITFTLWDVYDFWGNNRKSIFKSLAFFEQQLGMKSLLNSNLLIETEKYFNQQEKMTIAGMSDYRSSAKTKADPLWDKTQKATQRIIKNLQDCKTITDILNKNYVSEHPLYENFIGNNSLESDLLEKFYYLKNIKLTIHDLPSFKKNIAAFLDEYIKDYKNGNLDSRNKEFYGLNKHKEIFNQIRLQKQGLDSNNIVVDLATLRTLKNIDLNKVRLIETSLLLEKEGAISIKNVFPLKEEKDKNDLWGVAFKDIEKEYSAESNPIEWNGLKLYKKELQYKSNSPVFANQKTKKIKLLMMLIKQRNNFNKKITEQYISYDQIGKELEISSYSKRRSLSKAINDSSFKDLKKTLKDCGMLKEEIDKFFKIRDGYGIKLAEQNLVC